jgi:hypothetical protein
VKKAISNLLNLVFIIALAGVFSCKGPKGDTGPVGPRGDKGDTGTTGQTGPQGPAGQDGQDGQNGNANVTIISLMSTDITWLEGYYLERIANVYAFDAPEVNDDIINHGTVLGFCYISEEWHSLPIVWEDTDGLTRAYVIHTYSPNTITLYAFQTGDVLDPSVIEEYRFLLITDNTVTPAKGLAPEGDILTRMAEAGVDVENYYEVLDYFGIKH